MALPLGSAGRVEVFWRLRGGFDGLRGDQGLRQVEHGSRGNDRSGLAVVRVIVEVLGLHAQIVWTSGICK